MGWGRRSKGADRLSWRAHITRLIRLRFPLALKRTEHLPDEDLIFEGHAFGVVLLEPGFPGVRGGEELEVLDSADMHVAETDQPAVSAVRV
jgi:hypothetical protein